jgi:hypothetical protein
MKNAVFWDVAPCRYCVNRRFGERISSIFRIEKFASEDFSTLKMEAIRSHETSVYSISTRRHIPEDGILQI